MLLEQTISKNACIRLEIYFPWNPLEYFSPGWMTLGRALLQLPRRSWSNNGSPRKETRKRKRKVKVVSNWGLIPDCRVSRTKLTDSRTRLIGSWAQWPELEIANDWMTPWLLRKFYLIDVQLFHLLILKSPTYKYCFPNLPTPPTLSWTKHFTTN